jgi:DNA modification methylase
MQMNEIKFEHWPTSRLLPYARNPRKNDHVVDQMAAAITEFGFRIPIIARSTGEVVDGHLRLKAALRLGLETVPVILADDLTPAQIKAFRILANRSATWADWDEDLLRLELEELKLDDFDLALTGFDADELLEIMAGEETTTEGNTDEDAAPEVPVRPVSKPGDVWIMGQHRLLCGDATDPASYDTLLGTERVAMIFQDPPYNVDYANSPKDKLRGKHRPILNDNLGEGFQAFLLAALKPALQRCDGAIYIAMSSSELDTLQAAFRAAGGKWSTFIIWAKHTFTLGHADYQRQYEPILYGWREGANRHWCGDRDQGDVWEIKKPAKNALHPTQKPVEVPERAIRNSSRPGSLVLDCFGGSGSTLIACERTGRGCRVMELDPKYCDVIVRRWQDWTGQKAQRADDGLLFDELASDQPLEAGMID